MVLFGEVGDGFFLEDLEVGIADLGHDAVKTAVFFVAVFAAFVKVEADAGQEGDRAVEEAHDLGEGDVFGIFCEEVAAAFSFFAIEDACVF